MAQSEKSSPTTSRNSLSVEIGSWFKAHATGLGVFVIPVIVLVLSGLAIWSR